MNGQGGGHGIERILDRKDQSLGAVTGNRRDAEMTIRFAARFLEFLQKVVDALLAFLFRNQVQLVQDEPAGFFGKGGIVFFQLGRNGDGIVDGVGFGIERREIDEMHDETCARQMTQETVAEAGSFCGALNHTGNIGNDEATVFIGSHHAQVGVKRREGVIGDLGFGR